MVLVYIGPDQFTELRETDALDDGIVRNGVTLRLSNLAAKWIGRSRRFDFFRYQKAVRNQVSMSAANSSRPAE